MPLLSDTKLGPYEILSEIGAGGMGEVYRAHDTRLNRDVAIKVLPEYLTSDPERLRRFEQEARATAALSHPNILAIFEMDTHESVSYLVEELLEGETLRERLGRGPIPLRKAIDYGVQIAHGLAAAHDKGIVHRDLKPENLFVTKDGRVKILDFGLARLSPTKDTSGFEATQALGTEPGMVMGTVGYMSPEQVRGKTADHRADIFAFGTILYEMVTGKQGFRKPTSAETMTAILNEEPPAISQLTPTAPPGMQRVVHRCLEKNPEQRFQSASDMAFALEALSDSAITSGTGVHTVQEGGSNRSRIALAAGAALLAVLVVAGLVYFWMQPSAPPKASNYVQLTYDGQPKRLIGTDGSRLYLYLSGSDYQGMAEMSVSGGQPRKISILSSPNMKLLSLSSDGSELLVADGQGVPARGPLWSVPVLGGSPRQLGETAGQAASWSNDGKRLGYSNGGDVFVAKADGSEPHKLFSMKEPAFLFSPAWSPDGTRLRFDVNESLSTPSYIWEVGVDGSNPHRLLPGWNKPPNYECCGQWTPDGKYFVFLSRGQIWALREKNGFLGPASKPVQVTSSPMSLSAPIASRDGKKLFVVGATTRGALMHYDVKSGQFTPFLGGMSAEYIGFSPDGQWLAYVSFPDGILWRSKVDGSERLQLTYPPNYAILPRWSPDGKNIVFYEVPPDKPFKIYEVSLDGGSPRPLMPEDPSPQSDPNWSPDGGKIVFSGNAAEGSSAIHTLDLSTHQVTTLPGSQGYFSPRWSPDGRYIAAMTSDSKTLLLFDFQTQKWTEIARGTLGWPNWSKDGQYVYVMNFWRNLEHALLKIRLSDHTTERFDLPKNFVGTGYWGPALALMPDDSPLLLRDAGTYDVYSLDWEEP